MIPTRKCYLRAKKRRAKRDAFWDTHAIVNRGGWRILPADAKCPIVPDRDYDVIELYEFVRFDAGKGNARGWYWGSWTTPSEALIEATWRLGGGRAMPVVGGYKRAIANVTWYGSIYKIGWWPGCECVNFRAIGNDGKSYHGIAYMNSGACRMRRTKRQ